MKYSLKPEHPVTNEAAKSATGKSLDQWSAELDKADGLKLGRREINNRLYEQKIDPWWCATIAVEYEKHHDVRKKDGLYEGYFVCATKTITAAPADVFRAWSNSKELSKWFGSDIKADVKDGGSYESKDGDQGKFLRVRENKDIRMSFESRNSKALTQVDVQFQDKGKRQDRVAGESHQDSDTRRSRRFACRMGAGTRSVKICLRKKLANSKQQTADSRQPVIFCATSNWHPRR